MKAFFRKESVFLIILFLLVFGLRLAYLSQLRDSPLFSSPIVDAKYYDDWATAISNGQAFQEGPLFRAPLYAYFLAGIYSLFGHSYLAVAIVQFLIGSISVLLIYFLTKRVFGATAARVAAVIAGIYGTCIYFEGELLIPVLILFLDLLLVLAVLWAAERSGWWRWLLCGALLGLSAIARPNVLIFFGVLLPWMLVRFRRRSVAFGRSLSAIFGVLLGTALVILPVSAHNYFVGKDVVLISSQGGVNFFIGNNPDSDGISATLPTSGSELLGGHWNAAELAEKAVGRPLKASEVSNYWFRRGIQFMRGEPSTALRLFFKKVVLFWSGPEVSNNKDIYFFSGQALPLSFLLWRKWISCPFGILAPLALAGIVLAWRLREGRDHCLLVLFIFAYMVSVVLFFVTARFRMPVIPFLVPFAAYSLVSLFRMRRRGWFVLSLVLILVFGLMVNLNLTGYTAPSPVESHSAMGAAYLENGMYREAAAQFRQALAIKPQYIRSIVGLAKAYDGLELREEAIKLWERGVSLKPDMVELHFHLGFSYYAAGRLDDAVASWEEAVRLQPEYAQPHFQLGIVYEDQGEIEKAIAAYRMALQQNPLYVLANYNLGHLYKKLGRIEEAQAEFERAVENNDRFGDAYNSLAWLYAQQGIRLDEGIELMGRALALDDGKGAYWDTLAELYIKKGDLERAREIFRQMQQREPGEPFWTQRLKELNE